MSAVVLGTRPYPRRKLGAKVTAVDIAPNLLEQARVWPEREGISISAREMPRHCHSRMKSSMLLYLCLPRCMPLGRSLQPPRCWASAKRVVWSRWQTGRRTSSSVSRAKSQCITLRRHHRTWSHSYPGATKRLPGSDLAPGVSITTNKRTVRFDVPMSPAETEAFLSKAHRTDAGGAATA